jgi:hypothetical protein
MPTEVGIHVLTCRAKQNVPNKTSMPRLRAP